MKLTIGTSDFEALKRKIKSADVRIGSVLEDPLKSGARTCCVVLAQLTYPREEFKMKSKIGSEVSGLFSPGEFYETIRAERGEKEAKIFWAILNRDNDADLRKYLRKIGYGHISVRRSVPKSEYFDARDSTGGVADGTAQKTVVTNVPKIQTFIRQRWRTIGAGAAGWVDAGQTIVGRGRFSARGVPAWKKTGRHKKSKGFVSFGGVGGKITRARIYNYVDYITRICPEYLQDKAADIAVRRMVKAMKIAVRHEARQILKGTRGSR